MQSLHCQHQHSGLEKTSGKLCCQEATRMFCLHSPARRLQKCIGTGTGTATATATAKGTEGLAGMQKVQRGGLRLKEAGMLFQVAVLLAGLPQQLPQLRQRQLVILVCVRRLKQLCRAVQCLGLQHKEAARRQWLSVLSMQC